MTHPGDLLSALLDGELTTPERRSVEAHLEDCTSCRDELAGIESIRSSMRSLPTLAPPPGLIPEPAAPSKVTFLRPRWTWAAAGVAAAALAIGLAAGTASGPEPMDLDGFAEQHTARVLVQPGVQTVRAVLETP